ncbi:MAG: GEVED domain-containing protein [Bacteroidetes bacterium]|nr:GEVED domain-containing protein [Bacteroidota bacterium]
MEINPGVPCNSATQTLLVNAYGTPVISGPSPVCIDDLPNMYTASGPTPPGGFEWTITPPEQGTIESGQGLNSVNIRWNSTTNPAATLKVTTCGGSDTYTVVVNGPPPVTVTFDKTPVFCHLANETLTLSTASAADSYEWHQIDPAGNDIILPGNSAAEPININNLYLGTYKYYVRIVLDGCDATSNFVEVVIEDCQGGIGSCHCNGIPCPTVAYFRAYPICNRILLKEKSEVFYGASITSYLWTVTPPGHETFDYSTPYSPREPGLTVDASGTYTVTLEVFSATCSTTHSETVIVDLPLSDFTYSTPVCENTPTSFQANQNSPFYQFYWKFGDGSKSFTANTEHAFTPASTYDISLITYDLKGCISPITTKQIVVNPSPPCTITVSNTAFCPGKSVIFSGCSGMDTYQWYRDGSSISGANGQDYTASVPGEYWLEGSYISGGISCTSTSNHIYIYKITPPVAKIEIVGDDHFCVLPSGHVIVKLRCKPDITSYTYNWSSDATATFPPWNNSYQAVQIDVDVTLPAVLPVTYNFIVTVTDIDSWCEARDTICITFYRKPVVTVPLLYTCEGPAFPLASSPSPAGSYYYQWSNGATTPDITAMAPGFYSLTITDKESGCMASADAGFIYPKPDLSLFPLGCYPICNNTPIQLYVPLPLNELPPGDIYPNAYPYIAWYDNSLPFASGHQVSYSTNVTGLHQVSVKVYNNFGCQDSRGVLCLDSKDCLFDFGDAPDDPLPGNYKTNLAGNGARHIIDLSVHLGNNIDQETDGQPTKSADGDDSYGIPDDEDGVTMPAFIWRGALMQITVTASVPGYLDAWIDFDGDKSWDGPADHIFTNQSLVAMPGQNLLYFQVPSNAVLGQSYARFRFRTDNTPVSYEGLVLDGEVEDYAMEIIYCPSSPAGFIPGTIAPSQVIEAGTIPAMLTGSEPTGGTGPYDYQWQVSTTSGEFTDIAGATNLYYAPGALISATYYRLFQSSANGCGSGYTNVATITINPPFSSQLIVQNILVADTRCYNAAQTIYVAGPPSASPSLFYVLNGGHVTMIAGQNIIYYTGTIVVSGGYMNGFIASGGPWCGEKSASIVAAPEGSTELDPVPVKALFIVYPNPTTGGFSLEFTGIGETEEVSVEMYGMHGDRVYAAALKGMKKYDLSLAGKPAGVYFIRVISGKVAGTAKIIRQ